jgi:hypothetical protein
MKRLSRSISEKTTITLDGGVYRPSSDDGVDVMQAFVSGLTKHLNG